MGQVNVLFPLTAGLLIIRCKLEHKKFHTDVRKSIFTVRVTALEKAAQKVCGVSFSRNTQNLSGCFPTDLLKSPCFERGSWTQ